MNARDALRRWGWLLVALLTLFFGTHPAVAHATSPESINVGESSYEQFALRTYVYGYDDRAQQLQRSPARAPLVLRVGDALPTWVVGPSARQCLSLGSGVAAESATGAESALNGAQLSQHLAQLEKYGQAGSRVLESGRIRYYGDLSPANKPGEMIGRRLVREWDPSSGATRTWHETLDGNGTVRIVRPETGGLKTHYYFDEFGNYGGSW